MYKVIIQPLGRGEITITFVYQRDAEKFSRAAWEDGKYKSITVLSPKGAEMGRIFVARTGVLG